MIIAVIGHGSIGKRHATNLAAMNQSIAIYDPAMPNGYSINEIIHNSDAVVIASPTNWHLEHFSECLKSKPATSIFIEKPIFHINALMDYRAPKEVMVGYNLRFHSCVKKAKEWLDSGRIGKPLHAQFTLAQFSDKPPYLRDGVILNWSHELDLALYLLGHARLAASSTRLTDGKDDISDILLTHESGCRSFVHLDYVTKPQIRRFTIVGSDGHLAVDLESRNAYTNDTEGTRLFHGTDNWNENYIEEMQAFLDRIDGKETIGCTGEEGLEVLKICLEVRKQAGLT